MEKDTEELQLSSQADALVGYRAWRPRKRVAEGPEPFTHTVTYWLQSLDPHNTEKDEWSPGRAVHAKCRGSVRRHPPHHRRDVPHPRWSCGYSAYPSVPQLIGALRKRSTQELIIGEVAMWGRVVRSPDSIRSAFAVPTKLWVVSTSWNNADDIWARHSLQTYAVPVGEVRVVTDLLGSE